MSYPKIGEILIQKEIIDSKSLAALLKAAKDNSQSKHPLLSNTEILHYANEQQVDEILGNLCNTKVVSENDIAWDPDVMNLIPSAYSQKHYAIPYCLVENETAMIVACKKLLSDSVVEYLHKTTLKEIRMMLMTQNDFADLFQKAFPGSQPMNLIQMDEPDSEQQTVTVVDRVILSALEKRASDIHIEPEHQYTRIRIRIDGVMHTIGELPIEITRSVSSRIKILANLDITNRLIPQEGSFIFNHIELDQPPVNIRVSVLPEHKGEKIVLRLLAPEETLLAVNELGMNEQVYDLLMKKVKIPNGMVLVTGPAASGKSTTMYSMLNFLRDDKINLCTIEDPIEIVMSGVNQFQIDIQNTLTFESILHALLRQDPDVIMVGEIRNAETAEIALQAGLTGHLVFATLHTNDCPSAFTRLIEMGCDPFLVASSIRAVISQRLIRKVCDHCKASRVPRDEELKFYNVRREMIPEVAYGKGCEKCHGTGFAGRTGIFEVLPMSDELQNIIMNSAPPRQIKELMEQNKLTTLQQEGMRKLKSGVTTIEEVSNAIFLQSH